MFISFYQAVTRCIHFRKSLIHFSVTWDSMFQPWDAPWVWLNETSRIVLALELTGSPGGFSRISTKSLTTVVFLKNKQTKNLFKSFWNKVSYMLKAVNLYTLTWESEPLDTLGLNFMWTSWDCFASFIALYILLKYLLISFTLPHTCG